ncbi:hypothetical protein OAO87_03070 [bacterium]|nr:hypothetical protein [bacterium]
MDVIRRPHGKGGDGKAGVAWTRVLAGALSAAAKLPSAMSGRKA